MGTQQQAESEILGMITEQTIRPIINALLDAFPSLDGWFSGLTADQQHGMRKAWVRQVANLEPQDVQRASDRILRGEVDLPPNYQFDRLGVVLRSWGNVESQERLASEHRQTLREQAAPNADASAKAVARRFGPAIKCAAAWGAARRSGYVTEQQNAEAMAQVHRHHKQGDCVLPWPEVPAKERKSMVDFWK